MKCVCAVVSRCSRWWSFNVEANSANTGSDGEGKSEVTEETTDTATEALKTQLTDIEVQFCFVLQQRRGKCYKVGGANLVLSCDL